MIKYNYKFFRGGYLYEKTNNKHFGSNSLCNMHNGGVHPLIASAESYSDTLLYDGDLFYRQVDEDEDGTYDYIEISDCSESVTEIEIPSEIEDLPVTSIGHEAFYDCINLESITIPDSVASIGINAFYGTPWLEAKQAETPIVIVNNILIDGKTCSGDVIIPDSVTIIGDGAFFDCTSLSNITIPDSVTIIGDSAFGFCTSLESITIPDSVTSIGSGAFEDCTNLANVTIPDSVTIIGDSAFGFCTSLESITIPDSVTSIGNQVFSYCENLVSIDVSEANSYFSSTDGVLFNKDNTEILAYPNGLAGREYNIPAGVISVGDGAFDNCTRLSCITIPDSVTSIGDGAFSDCTRLSSITIPDSVTSIGKGAFFRCSSLSSITISGSVTSIGEEAFCDTPWLEAKQAENPLVIVNNILIDGSTCSGDVAIPDGVTYIPYCAFSCSSLESITIPDSVTSIGEEAFYECSHLESVYISDIAAWCNIEFGDYSSNPLRYADNLYLDDELVTDIVIPEGVTNIPYRAFSCSSLESITIPDSVTSIGNYAFEDCTSLESITIPDSVTSIGYGAFSGCTSLESITIPDSVTSIRSGAFEYCTNLASVTIGNGVTSIEDSTFYGCTSLASVTIGNGVTSIGYEAFYGCTSLTSITIPDSVMMIRCWAFFSCTTLNSITIKNPECKFDDSEYTICNGYDENSNAYFNGIIYGYENSTAHAYAEKYNRTFVALDEEPLVTTPAVTTAVTTNAYVSETTKTTVTTKTTTAAETNNNTSQTATTTNTTVSTVPASSDITTTTTSSTQPSVLLGDANEDGKLNVRDAAFIAAKLALGKSDELPECADFNGDGKINVRDAAAIAKFLASGKK